MLPEYQNLSLGSYWLQLHLHPPWRHPAGQFAEYLSHGSVGCCLLKQHPQFTGPALLPLPLPHHRLLTLDYVEDIAIAAEHWLLYLDQKKQIKKILEADHRLSCNFLDHNPYCHLLLPHRRAHHYRHHRQLLRALMPLLNSLSESPTLIR